MLFHPFHPLNPFTRNLPKLVEQIKRITALSPNLHHNPLHQSRKPLADSIRRLRHFRMIEFLVG